MLGEAVEVAIARRSVFDDFDQSIQALTDGIGQGSVDEGHDVHEVQIPQGADERALAWGCGCAERPSSSV